MDELIKKLQDFKCSQLASLQKFPILDEEGLIERKDEILDESGDLVDKISILQSQRDRLMCMLTLDNFQLFMKLYNQTQKKLLGQVKRQYILYGDEFLINKIPVHQKLKSWYIELKDLNQINSGGISSDAESPTLVDKLAFNIAYEPFCSKCKELIGLNIAEEANIYQLGHTLSATTSFSTCRKGFCCRISLQSPCRLCQLQSIKCEQTKDLEEVSLNVDPCFGVSAANNVSIKQLEEISVKSFLTEIIWPEIDRVSSTMYKG